MTNPISELNHLPASSTAPPEFRYVLFERINPERNESRFYYLAWQPTLFDGGSVVRLWGRKGKTQNVLHTPVATLEEAWPLLRRLIRLRLGRGYRVVEYCLTEHN
jgi:predicted DNA-binding WGR domain protein